jgi:hypothetical protein
MSDDKDKKREINPASKFLTPSKPTDASLEYAKNPKEIADQVQGLFSNTGFKSADFKGYTNHKGEEQKAKWQKEDLTALVSINDLHLLDDKRKKAEGQRYLIPVAPKITVSQSKNLDTLIVLLEKQNRKRNKKGEEKTADIEFYFRDYAKIRGYTDEEIAKSGNFNNELKRDLISGGVTSYILEKEKSYLIGSFYTVEVPKVKSKEKWRVYFNEPYKSYLLNIKQFYPILLKAIADKNTDKNKGYLYFFFKMVLGLSNNPKTGYKTRIKISTLLERIKIGEKARKRPQEAYKVLAECISYVASKYGDILTQIRILNPKEEVKVINDLDYFKKADYEQFKGEILSDLGLSDIREAMISFNAISLKDKGDEEPKNYREGNFLP